ncbi:glycoside hydrolase family 3 N-terminal domain-containing protein [Sinomonas humi]|uniref:glycoside hydrolase family 3 N-terminal domain-containing protein n=1 Tax=Sinomonas humi TaxID=1338436 RepID=UPI00068EF02F|nr:glycoside hydrolase family 3 N-terminal domain-containing protein [Sinomonas humi]
MMRHSPLPTLGFAAFVALASVAPAAPSATSSPTAGGPPPSSAPPVFSLAASTTDCASTVLSGMTLAQQVGQLFMMGVTSTGPTSTQLGEISSNHLGGVVLTGDSAAGVTGTLQITNQLQAQATSTAGVALSVAVDQEGGYVQVLSGPGFSSIPTALAQGSMDPTALRQAAAQWGRELLNAGITLNLAPVLDTVPASLGGANIPIGYYEREYGYTPDVVTSHGTAFASGMADAKVQATGKHFPGLGRVTANTDTTFGVTDTVTTRHDAYLQPFAAAISQGIPAIMVSLAQYNAIDGLRAAFSPTVMQGMLRSDLGFGGEIISDSMAAVAVSDLTPANRAMDFLTAGGTVVLDTNPADIPPMVSAVVARAQQDPSFLAQVQAAAGIVLEQKYRAGLVSCPAAYDPIVQHYQQLGGSGSFLGQPSGSEYRIAGGRAQDYAGGTIYWSYTTGAFEVNGGILSHYRSLGGPGGFLGFPLTDESGVPGGRYNNFTGGSIYWSPATNAREVHGAILGHYRALGGPGGFLGFPLTDETGTPGGRYNDFTGGSIYWSPASGAHEVNGGILGHYRALGGPVGFLGFPLTDETGTPDGIGRYNNFTGGSVYWTAGTGAREVHGAIRAKWGSLGYERSPLGYPVSDEYGVPGGRRNDFQHGSIVWNQATGTTQVI